VLPDENHCVRDAIERHGESPAVRPEHLLVMPKLILVIVKCRHEAPPAHKNTFIFLFPNYADRRRMANGTRFAE
jgi:hypothetical protein